VALTPEEKAELAQLRAEKDTFAEPKEPTFGEKAKAVGYGAATGLAGGLGELEKFGAYTVPQALGFQEEGQQEKLGGRPTLFPTVEEAQKGLAKVGIQKPREEVSEYQTAGEILGGFGTSIPGMVRGGAKALLGTTSKTGEAVAKEAEKLGFKLSPAQVRAQEPVGAKGATGFSEQNQSLANKLASKGTGKEASEIDSKFIGDRLKDLGGEYDKIYKGKTFNIDKPAVDAINQISAMEAQLPGVAGVSPVKQVADEIISSFQSLANRQGAVPNTFGIEGEALQRMRNALTQRARSTSAGNAREIYNLVDQIDASIARNHPAIAAKLDVVRPQYRNTIILEDLYKQGGIHQGNISLDKLGNMMRTERGAVRRGETDIDKLGEIGREMQLKALWESAGSRTTPGTDVLKSALGTGLGMGATGLGLRSRPARAVQRQLAKSSGKPIPGAVPTALGTAVRPLNQDENE
jgi:hypothetical protein